MVSRSLPEAVKAARPQEDEMKVTRTYTFLEGGDTFTLDVRENVSREQSVTSVHGRGGVPTRAKSTRDASN